MIKSLFSQKFIIYLLSVTILSFLTSFFLLEILVALLTILWVVDIVSNKKFNLDKISYIILALLLVKIISSVTSGHSRVSFNALLKESIFFLSFFSFNHFVRIIEKEKRFLLLKVLLYSGLFIALIGITKFNLGSLRAESITSGSATFSVFIIIVLVLSLFLKEKLFFRDKAFLEILIITVLLTACALTFSKANIFAALLILAAAIFLKKTKVSVVLTSLLLTGLLVIVSVNINSKYYTNNIKDESYLFSNRDLIWKGAVTLVFDKPFLGHGVGTFKEIYPHWDLLTDKGVGDWHNQFIQIYMETGIVGLLIFLYLVYHVYREWFIMYKLKRYNDDTIILNSLAAAITALIITSLATNFISSVIIAPIFSFMLALYQSYLKDYNSI
ncbi:MAG: O-antigen ligase family protein [Bacteroidota bacterium]